MERLLFTMVLEPGTEDEYERRHRELWPDMREALVRSGYTNYTLFRRGSEVVGYAECIPDAATAGAAMAGEEVTGRWNASFDGILKKDAQGEFSRVFAPIWHLDESPDAGSAS